MKDNPRLKNILFLITPSQLAELDGMREQMISSHPEVEPISRTAVIRAIITAVLSKVELSHCGDERAVRVAVKKALKRTKPLAEAEPAPVTKAARKRAAK